MVVQRRVPVTRSGEVVSFPSRTRVDGLPSGLFGPGDYPLAVAWIPNHKDLPLHTHDFVELALVLDGSAQQLLPGEGFEITAGSVQVIPTGMPHGYARARGLEVMNILFDPRRLHLSFKDLPSASRFRALFNPEPSLPLVHGSEDRLFLEPPARREMTELAWQLGAELHARGAGYRCMSAALLAQVLVRLSRACMQVSAPRPPTPLGIDRAIRFIESHFEQPLRIGDLAARAGTCARSLQRHFQRTFGASPVGYVNRLRVEKASELLLKTDMNITEVAGVVGIEDSNYFSRLFHQIAGTSPSGYRRYWRQNPRPVHTMEGIPPHRPHPGKSAGAASIPAQGGFKTAQTRGGDGLVPGSYG